MSGLLGIATDQMFSLTCLHNGRVVGR